MERVLFSLCGPCEIEITAQAIRNGKIRLQDAPQHFLIKLDRKSTRLNSSHSQISYAVFCLKKKKRQQKGLGVELRNDRQRRDSEYCHTRQGASRDLHQKIDASKQNVMTQLCVLHHFPQSTNCIARNAALIHQKRINDQNLTRD